MGTNCATLVADLFLFCYERDFMESLSEDKQAGVIDAFYTTFRYLDDILNINIVYFDNMVSQIYPSELRLNKANTSDTKAAFLDLENLFFCLILFTFIKPHPDLSFYSLVLHLQQCSEMYKNIRTSRRLRKSSKNIPFVCRILILFHVVVLVSWLFILILLSGDIELNPGPYSGDGSADTSDILSSTSFDSLNNHLTFFI